MTGRCAHATLGHMQRKSLAALFAVGLAVCAAVLAGAGAANAANRGWDVPPADLSSQVAD